MSKKLLLILILLDLANTLCNEGCLKCSKNDQCQICDVSKFMKLRNGKCESVQEENCTSIQLDGTCLNCENNFYVDPTSKKCVAVEEQYLIENCLGYGETQQCLLCDKEYYTLNGKCIQVSIKISNCKIYLNDTTCQECDVGYLLSLNGKTCDTKPSISNCQGFSTIECLQCSKDFIINKNIYQSQIFNVNSEFEIDFLLTWIFVNKGLLIQQDNICQKQVVENCQEVEDFDSCKKCNDGYYLTDSKFCLEYPESIILNCESYSSATVCGKCTNKYYKKNSNTCLPVTLVENCLIYGQAENDQGCKECEPNFFLDSGECKARQNNITNCQEFELIDRCKTCGPSYILTNDRLKCLPSIMFCDSYQSSSQENTELTCQQCIDGYFLVGNTCKQGLDANCSKYTESSTFENQICMECVNKFYLSDNNNCLEIATIANCSKYHKTKDKSCLQCQGLFFNFYLENKCEIFTEISNCILYNKTGETITCTQCADTYYLDTETNKCEDISVTHPFCNKVDTQRDSCTECQSNKILVNKQCVDNMPYNTEFCEIVNDNQVLANADCNVCKESSYPHQFTTATICLTEPEFGQELQVDKSLCLIYKDDGSCKICKENYVENEGTCITACPAGKYMIKQKEDRVNYCVDEDADYEDGCQIMTSYRTSRSIRLTCGKCKDGYLPYLEDSSTQSYWGTANDLSLNIMQDYLTMNVGVQCKQLTALIILNKQPNSQGQAPTPDPNCILWTEQTTNNYYCQRCKDSYTFKIVDDAPSECEPDTQFNSQKIYSFNEDTVRYVSGQQCADRSLSVLVQIDSSSSIVNTKTNLKNISNQCVSKKQIEDEFPGNYVENCAVYFLNGSTFSCQECFPGYRLSNVLGVQCDPIEHCNGFLWFSSCSQCTKGYAFLEKTSKEINYTQCESIYTELVDDNCLSVESGGSCQFCKKGYFLNKDKACEKILFPKCSSTENFNYGDKLISNYPLEYYLYYQGYYQGCSQCLEGYISINKTINTNVCLFSYFLRDHANNPELFAFESHCKKYKTELGVDDDLYCHECYKGKIVRETFTQCLDEIPNCKILKKKDECKECISNQYANIDGTCKKLEIENCEEYNVLQSSLEECKTCKDSYFPEGKKCIKTEVLNCKKPSSLTECNQCADNFNLVTLSEDRDYCISLSTLNNCKTATIVTDGQYGGKITCTECAQTNSYITTQVDTPELFVSSTECIRIDSIENCGELKFPQILEATSFACDQCVGNYYLSDSTLSCLQRTNLSMNCEIFDPANDKCQTCNNTSFLVDQGKDCQTFPDGLVGCKKYKFRYTCEICHIGFYLVEGDCKQIPESNLITNCEVYKNENECQECATGFFINENVCVEVKVTNCLVLQDENTCQECNPGYGIVVKGQQIDCELISKNRCLIFEQTQPYPCLVCNEGFYPDEAGECTESKPKIDFCIQQESLEKCTKCQKGSVLSKDQTKCYKNLQYTSKIPFDCEQSVEKEPFCTSCQPGYKFNSEGLQCIQCNAAQNNQGCSLCDPFDDNKCFMCKSGYTQDQDGLCNIQTTQQPTEVTETANLKVYGFEFILILMLLLQNQIILKILLIIFFFGQFRKFFF